MRAKSLVANNAKNLFPEVALFLSMIISEKVSKNLQFRVDLHTLDQPFLVLASAIATTFPVILQWGKDELNRSKTGACLSLRLRCG